MKHKTRKRNIRFKSYNSGIVDGLKNVKNQQKITIILVLFMVFQLLSPFGSFISRHSAKAATVDHIDDMVSHGYTSNTVEDFWVYAGDKKLKLGWKIKAGVVFTKVQVWEDLTTDVQRGGDYSSSSNPHPGTVFDNDQNITDNSTPHTYYLKVFNGTSQIDTATESIKIVMTPASLNAVASVSVVDATTRNSLVTGQPTIDGNVKISWVKYSGDARVDKVRIFRKSSAFTSTTYTGLSGETGVTNLGTFDTLNSSSYTDTTAAADNSNGYYYAVLAYDSSSTTTRTGMGDYSISKNSAKVVTTDKTGPNAGPTVSAVAGDKQVTFTVSAAGTPTGDALGVAIWQVSGQTVDIIKNANYVNGLATVVVSTDSVGANLINGNTYTFRLRQYDICNNFSTNIDKTISPTNVVAVSSVAVNPASLSMVINGVTTLIPVITPTNATNKAVTWASSDTAIATVTSPQGVVTAKATGTAKITVTTVSDAKTAEVNITVGGSAVSATGVTTLPSSIIVAVDGQDAQIDATISPEGATNQNVTWTSSDATVATVNSNGLISPIKVGTTIITARTVDGSFPDTTMVSVIAGAGVGVSGISLQPTSLNLLEGGTNGTIVPTVTPSNATNKGIAWISSDYDVASVTGDNSSATIRPVGFGTAVITAVTSDGNFSDTVDVTVSVPLQTAISPIFDPVGGSYTSTQSVELSTPTVGAEVHYTLDGTTPTVNSTKYTSPISVSSTKTIKAITTKTGMNSSTVVSSSYTITLDTCTNCDIESSDKTVTKNNATIEFTASPSNLGDGFNLAVTEKDTGSRSAYAGKTTLKIYDITPSKTLTGAFAATITLGYPSGQTYKSGDTVLFWNTLTNTWEPVGNIPGIVGSSTISFLTTHFSEFAIFTDSATSNGGAGTGNDPASVITTGTGGTTVGGILPTTGSTVLNMLLNFMLALGGYLLLNKYLKKSRFSAFIG